MIKRSYILCFCLLGIAWMAGCDLSAPPKCVSGQRKCLNDDMMHTGIGSVCGIDGEWNNVVCPNGCDGNKCAEDADSPACETDGDVKCVDTQVFSVSFQCLDKKWFPSVCDLNAVCDGAVCGSMSGACKSGEKMCAFVEAIGTSMAVECVNGSRVAQYCEMGCDGDVCKAKPEPPVVPCVEDNGVDCGKDEFSSQAGWNAARCESGKCVVYQCLDGYTMVSNNCFPSGNCCGKACDDCVGMGMFCSSANRDEGECVVDCLSGMIVCDDVCINPSKSQTYCGADSSCHDYESCSVDKKCAWMEDKGRYQCVCVESACGDACFNLNVSVEHCGRCDNDCTELAGWENGNCVDGICQAVECKPPYVLKKNVVDGTEMSVCAVSDDVLECGDLAVNCAEAVPGWGSGRCEEGVCIIETCAAGLHVNSLDPDNLFCEENTKENCGEHGNACPGDEACNPETGTCGCGVGQESCDGVCVDLLSNTAHCSACGLACNIDNADTMVCEAGVCKAATCVGGFHVYADICEVNDNNSCGEHDKPCQVGAVSNSTTVQCGLAGVCEATACITGYHVFEGRCEKDDNDHCGSHEGKCTTALKPGSTSVSCGEGVCVATACDSSHVRSGDDCIDKNCTEGEVKCIESGGVGTVQKCSGNTWTTQKNCAGSCKGNSCGDCKNGDKQCSSNDYQTCDGGSWKTTQTCTTSISGATATCDKTSGCGYSCPSGKPTTCGTACVNTTNDINNCGRCGNKCTAPSNGTATCSGGSCGFTCNSGYCKSGSSCISNQSDVNNCGACGTKCTAPSNGTATCSSGTCGFTCNSGYCKSGSSCISNQSDVNNCGACGTKCTAPSNGTATCSGGSCGFTCNSGYCKSGSSCISNQSDVNNCGACGTKCTAPSNGTATCSSGTCGFTCNSGYCKSGSSCVSKQTDMNHCGACGNVCNTSKVSNSTSVACSSGVCIATACSSGYSLVSGKCEVTVCTEGSTRCINSGSASTTGKMQKCISNKWVDQSTCSGNASCNSSGSACGVCINGALQCTDSGPGVADVLKECKTGAWIDKETCTTGAPKVGACLSSTSCGGSKCASGFCTYPVGTGSCVPNYVAYTCGSGCLDCSKSENNPTMPDNAQPVCTGGACNWECKNNYHINGSACEPDTFTACGSADHSCSSPNGTTECRNGKCQFTNCSSGHRLVTVGSMTHCLPIRTTSDSSYEQCSSNSAYSFYDSHIYCWRPTYGTCPGLADRDFLTDSVCPCYYKP